MSSPIKPEALHELLHGVIREKDIGSGRIYSSAERDLVSSLWLESIVIEIPSAYLRAQALTEVLQDITQIIHRVADPKPSMALYALSATRAGDQLVRRFGFQLASPRTTRANGHDLYCASFEALETRRQHVLSKRWRR